MGKRLLAIATLVLILAGMLWFLWLPAQNRACGGGICQCAYCDQIVQPGNVCIVNGHASAPIGCVGSCNGCAGGCLCSSGKCADGKPYACSGCPGLGGCGAEVAWCRGVDCCGSCPNCKKTPTPAPTATPTPPPGCRGEWVVLRKPGADWKYAPPYPVVVGQDESARGFDVLVDTHGGWAEKRARRPAKHCDDATCARWHWVCRVRTLAHYDDPIVRILMSMDLSQKSRAWIEGELASRYPGAHVQEKLPWERTLWTGRAMSVETGIRRYPAQDPGDHEGEITVETAGTPLNSPQEYVIRYRVPVYLKDATEWQEWK